MSHPDPTVEAKARYFANAFMQGSAATTGSHGPEVVKRAAEIILERKGPKVALEFEAAVSQRRQGAWLPDKGAFDNAVFTGFLVLILIVALGLMGRDFLADQRAAATVAEVTP